MIPDASMNSRSETRTADQIPFAIALNQLPGIGPRQATVLLEAAGSPEGVFELDEDTLAQIPGMGKRSISALLAARPLESSVRIMDECRRHEIRILLRGQSDYPSGLEEICDSPAVLFERGQRLSCDTLAVAVVGSRRCTAYGLRHAERLSSQLARAGLTVVSGLARGIDRAAHHGALSAGGRTLAILPAGVSRIYPPEHQDLAEEICQQGALLSEYPPGKRLLPGLFPQRNRIISGLSLAVILIEASRRSGALHTARHALEQGREVMALPGAVDSLASAGCHDLIRDGVTLIRNVDDVLEALGPLQAPINMGVGTTVSSPRELVLNELEGRVLNVVGFEPSSVDQVLTECPEEASQVLATLTVLEMRRLIRRLPGNQLIRTGN